MNPITVKLKGVTYDNCQENIRLYSFPCFRTYEMSREPYNSHDQNAIRVGMGFYKMGYVPTAIAQVIAPLMDQGHKFVAEHVCLNQSPWHDTVGLTVKIIEREENQHV